MSKKDKPLTDEELREIAKEIGREVANRPPIVTKMIQKNIADQLKKAGVNLE
jgi:hypothetical protein